MAVDVIPGEVYEAKDIRSGSNWTMFKVKAEKGRQEIPVFVDKAEAFHEGDRVKVTKITKARLSARKDKDGNWQPSYSVAAEVQVVGQGDGFKEEDPDDILPF